jgi:hypothetical protein
MIMDADTVVDQMLSGAWNHLRADLKVVDIEAINESVFRYFCIHELAQNPDLRYETEWQKRVDLHVTSPTIDLAIEFKFYALRFHRRDGQPERPKGGPSKKNEAEFTDSWKKLASLCSSHSAGPIAAYLILVYQASDDETKLLSFHRSYGSLDLRSLPDGCVACAIRRMEPIEWKPGHRMHCMLFRLELSN